MKGTGLYTAIFVNTILVNFKRKKYLNLISMVKLLVINIAIKTLQISVNKEAWTKKDRVICQILLTLYGLNSFFLRFSGHNLR